MEEADAAITVEQQSLINQLTDAELAEIDEYLISESSSSWRKVARLVGRAMMDLPCRVKGIPDVFYSARIKMLVASGLLESQGTAV